MKQTYTFSREGSLEFDDSKSVQELIAYAFDTFGYYEPMGMDAVTLYQPGCYPRSSNGWFTTDVTLSCAEEILQRDQLCFAYHIPNLFYFAEGGWGHHMPSLGNRPPIPNEVSLMLKVDDGNRPHTVVINGTYTFRDVVRFLKEKGYVDLTLDAVRIVPVGTGQSYSIPLSDPVMGLRLTQFEPQIEADHGKHLNLGANSHIYHTVFNLT